MDVGSNSHFRLPPDNVGKRMQALKHVHLEYASGLFDLNVGDTVVGDPSGASGVIIQTESGNTTISGLISVVFSEGNLSEFQVGDVLKVSGTTYATVSSETLYYTQGMHLMGANHPHQAQHVDEAGAAFIRYAEGEQQLDAFGLSRQTTPTQIGDYFFGYDDLPNEFSEEVVGVGTCVHIPEESSIRLSIGSAANDQMTRTTNRYHIYQPGFGQLINMTVVMGDTGKTGVVRAWGAYDDEDGVFFQHNEDHLSLVIRSSVTGSVLETHYNITDWNGDKVDGSGSLSNLSKFNLDLSKLNIFWIDYQWLGAGRVRFGVINDAGSRITMHTVENAGKRPYPYMKTGTLPLRFEIYNTGATGSGSELKVTCCSVVTDGLLVPDRKKRTVKRSAEIPTLSIPDTETAIVSVRSKTTINGIVNRKIGIPELMSLYVTSNPIVLRVYKLAFATGGTWDTDDAASSIEINSTLTGFDLTGSRQMMSYYYDAGAHREELPDNFGYQGENIRLNADGSQDEYVITMQCLTAAGTAEVDYSFSWIDMG